MVLEKGRIAAKIVTGRLINGASLVVGATVGGDFAEGQNQIFTSGADRLIGLGEQIVANPDLMNIHEGQLPSIAGDILQLQDTVEANSISEFWAPVAILTMIAFRSLSPSFLQNQSRSAYDQNDKFKGAMFKWFDNFWLAAQTFTLTAGGNAISEFMRQGTFGSEVDQALAFGAGAIAIGGLAQVVFDRRKAAGSKALKKKDERKKILEEELSKLK